MKNPYYYLGQNPTVDLMIINPKNEVLMIQRGDDSPACPGMWALPGGFVDTHAKAGEYWQPGLETPEDASLRETQEEANFILPDTNVIPVGKYEGNGRDPRDNDVSWSCSHAFYYKIDAATYEAQKDSIEARSDAKNVKWIPIEELLKMKLAFDHNRIIQDALEKMMQVTNNSKQKFMEQPPSQKPKMS